MPKRANTWSASKRATVVASWFLIGNASAHLEKWSRTVRIYLLPAFDTGCGPVISMAILSHGSPTGADCNRPCFGASPRV